MRSRLVNLVAVVLGFALAAFVLWLAKAIDWSALL